MRVHGIICSYLGDGEYDIGKTGQWLNSCVNTLFFYDMSYGEAARKYAVDYAKTFPDAQFAYHPATVKGFYEDAPLFRQMAFQAALDAWKYADGDWVVFIDASESVSSNVAYDQLQLDSEWPNLLDTLLSEARAGTNAIKMPFHVFLQQGVVAEEYMSADTVLGNSLAEQIPALEAAIAAETNPVLKADLEANLAESLMLQEANDSVLYWTNDPHYLAATSLDRMFRVGYAKTLTGTAWRRLDTFAQAVGGAAQHATIVSYSYARYGEGPPPWTEATDGGWANRKLIQGVRTVGLPQTTYATADPAGAAHPVGTQSPAYCYLYANYDTGDGDPDFNKYVALWRQNPRDGVWYVNYELGPVPTNPLTGDPSVDTDDWERQHASTTGPAGTGRP
jgi:hypothetical protein